MKTAAFLLILASSVPVLADDALGTLTVKGKTTVLKEVAAAEQADPETPSDKWLVILASDRKVAEGDRSVARLAELAKDGKLHAVRILWRVGTDTVRVVPYDAALAQSGRMGHERPTINLRRYGSGKLDAEFRSKMVGQDWHFHANVKAGVAAGGVVELEPEAEAEDAAEAGPAAAGGGKKVALGKLGYEYTEESFRTRRGRGKSRRGAPLPPDRDVAQRARQGRGPPHAPRRAALRQPAGGKAAIGRPRGARRGAAET